MATQFNNLFRIEFCSCVKYHMVWLASSSEHSLPLAHSDGANATNGGSGGITQMLGIPDSELS